MFAPKYGSSNGRLADVMSLTLEFPSSERKTTHHNVYQISRAKIHKEGIWKPEPALLIP